MSAFLPASLTLLPVREEIYWISPKPGCCRCWRGQQRLVHRTGGHMAGSICVLVLTSCDVRRRKHVRHVGLICYRHRAKMKDLRAFLLSVVCWHSVVR